MVKLIESMILSCLVFKKFNKIYFQKPLMSRPLLRLEWPSLWKGVDFKSLNREDFLVILENLFDTNYLAKLQMLLSFSLHHSRL